jgi:transposase
MGIKPVCPFQQVFKSTYVFGAFSPINGDKFVLELPHCNTNTFQIFLNEFSTQNPTELKIIMLDNGAFHKAHWLQIPDNIVLLFIPPYSPELNPSEKVWWLWKRHFSNSLMKTLDEVSEFIHSEYIKTTEDVLISLCLFQYIQDAPFWIQFIT